MDMENLFNNIKSIDDLNKAIENSTNETNHLLEELGKLEAARRGGDVSPTEYEREKASIEKYLLKEQEKTAALSEILQNYNRIMDIYGILRTTREQSKFNELLNELNQLKETLPKEMKDNLDRTHILNEKGNRIIEIKATTIEEAHQFLEESLKETEKLQKEMKALEDATRTDNLHPNKYYIKERETIEFYIELEKEKQAIYNEIISSYDRIIELYEKSVAIADEDEYKKVIDETNQLKEKLPLGIRLSIEQKYVYSEEVNRIIKISAESKEEIDQLVEKSEKEIEKLRKELSDLEESVKTDNLYPNKYYIKERERIEHYLKIEEAKLVLFRKIQSEYNKVLKNTKPVPETKRESNLTDQDLIDAVQKELDKQEKEEKEQEKEKEEMKKQIESKIKENEDLINKYKDDFNNEINNFKEKELEDNNINFEKEENNHLDILNNINDKYKEKKFNNNKLSDYVDVIDNKKEKIEVNSMDSDEDLIRQIKEHQEKRDKIAKQLLDTYNKIRDFKLNNVLGTMEEVNDFYSLFGPDGPLAQLEKELNKEDEILNNLNNRLNQKNKKPVKQPVIDKKPIKQPVKQPANDKNSNNKRKYEDVDSELLNRQLRMCQERKYELDNELQQIYNKIRNNNNPNNDRNSVLGGQEGSLARIERQIEDLERRIKEIEEELNIRRNGKQEKKQEPVVPTNKDDKKKKEPKSDDKDEKKDPINIPEGKTPIGLPGGKTPLGLPDGGKDKGKKPDDSKDPGQDKPDPIGPGQDQVEPENKRQARSLNTILASIILDPETNEPVTITRRQRKSFENGNISVGKRFVSELSNDNIHYNLASIAPAIIHFPISLFQKLSGKILTTRKTKKNMKIVRENLDKLPPEDLEVLEREYKGNTVISARGMLGVDGLIQERIERYRYQKIEIQRATMKALYDKVLNDYNSFRNTNELLRSINERRISDAELNRLMEERGAKSRNHLTRILKADCDSYLHGKAEEIRQIRELRIQIQEAYSGGLHGQEEDFRAKSTRMNERGKRFAKDVSTSETYEFTKILGQLEDAEKLAIENGDDLEALRLFIAQEKKKVTATEQHRSIFGWRETGLSNYQPIPESLDYRPDPYVRNLLTTISVAGLTVGAIHEIQNRIAAENARINAQAAQNYQNAVNQHNQVNQAASAHNVQQGQIVNARGHEMAGRSDDISRGMQQQTGGAISGRRAVDEYADNDLTGWSMNGQYHSLDDVHHAATQQAADHASQTLTDIQNRLATGQITDVQALREMQALSDTTTQQFVDACQRAIPICKQYAASHPQFEYAGYIENLERFVQDPNAINQLNEAAIRSVEIGQELQGITILPYEQLAATLQYLPVEIQSQLFALGSAALLTGRAASQAQYLKKHGAEYNAELTKRVQEIDRKDKERQQQRKKKETEDMLKEDEQVDSNTRIRK